MIEKKKLHCNLLQQDVYCRDVIVYKKDLKDDYAIKSYLSQDRVVEDHCVKDKISVQEYPITPETVNSYQDSTNYKLDVNAAVAAPSRGKNLGDVSSVQHLLQMSPEDLHSFFVTIQDKINSYKKSVSADTKISTISEVNTNE